MPVIVLPIHEPRGPLLVCRLARAGAKDTGQPFNFLIDTGSNQSSVDESVVEALKLESAGKTELITPTDEREVQQFSVKLTVPHEVAEMTIDRLVVTQSKLVPQGFEGILGRDVLSRWLVLYDGVSRQMTIGY